MGGYAISIVEDNVFVRGFKEPSRLNSTGGFQIWAEITGDVNDEFCG